MKKLIASLLLLVTATAHATQPGVGAANQVFRVGTSAGRPVFGAVKLDSSAAVTAQLPVANGGTAGATQTAGFDNLSPGTTKGDLIVHNGTDNIRVPVGTDSFTIVADSVEASGVKYFAVESSKDIANMTLAASVAANALTITLKTKSAGTPSSTDPVRISFRNATASTGTFVQGLSTAATTLVISSGSTLGHTSAVAEYIYVYALYNAGTIELAASTNPGLDEGSVQSTTAEGGGGLADSATAIYSTTARSNVPMRLLGRFSSTQAAAGTWATAISEISLPPFDSKGFRSEVLAVTGNGYGSTNTSVRRFTTFTTIGTDITATDSATLGTKFMVNRAGVYSVSYTDSGSGASGIRVGLTLNGTQPTTALQTITDGSVRCQGLTGTLANTSSGCTWTGIMLAGHYIWAQTDTTSPGESARGNIVHIVRVGD